MNLDKETRSEILMCLYYFFGPLNNDRLSPYTNPYNTTIVTRELGVPVLTQRRRRRKREWQKKTSLDKQNNNLVRALRFFFLCRCCTTMQWTFLYIFRFYIGREHKTKIVFIFFELNLHGSVCTGCPSQKIVGSKICRDPCQGGLLKLFA